MGSSRNGWCKKLQTKEKARVRVIKFGGSNRLAPNAFNGEVNLGSKEECKVAARIAAINEKRADCGMRPIVPRQDPFLAARVRGLNVGSVNVVGLKCEPWQPRKVSQKRR